MTGGASNLAAFMQTVQNEREKTNAKLDKLTKKLNLLDNQVTVDSGASGKIIDYLSKKTMVMEK